MKRHSVVLWLSVLFISLAVALPANAQVEEKTESKDSGALSGFLKILGDAAQDVLEDEVQEEIDDWAGTYKGRIGEVVLLERRGNAVTFEVKYNNVKRSDGVYVTGEVLQWGEVQEGFNTTVSPVQEKSGSVKLTIGHQQQDDSGWGLPAEDVATDQIRLSLVRETNPDRPFGSLVYDFQKTWTASSDIEVLPEDLETAEEAPEEAIELAEGETPEEGQNSSAGSSAAKPSVSIVRPGTVMSPSKAATTQRTATSTAAAPATIRPLSAKAVIPTVTKYNFYENAGSAKWKNTSKDLTYPGSSNDKSGFVRSLASGVICPGNNAINLLETHPEWVNGGNIEGRYPLMTIGSNVKFMAVGALLKGAETSDGVIMSVYVLHENKRQPVLRKRINSKNYSNLEANLSDWAGKTVQIILNVSAGQTSSQDWAVWVNPRLTNE